MARALGLLIAAAILLNSASFLYAVDGQQIGELANLFDRQQGRCGVDAAFVVCRLLGKSIAYEEVEAATPFSRERGTSLFEFCRSMRSFGIPMIAVQTSLRELEEGTVPVVLLLQDGDEAGHYMVVAGITEGIFTVVDARGDKPIEMDRSKILEQWRGVAVVRAVYKRSYSTWAVLAAGATAMVFLCWMEFRGGSRIWLSCFRVTFGLILFLAVGTLWYMARASFSSPNVGHSKAADNGVCLDLRLPSGNMPIGFQAIPVFRSGDVDISCLQLGCTSVVPYWRYRRFGDVLHALRVFGPDADLSTLEMRHVGGEDTELLNMPHLLRYLTEPIQYQADSGSTQPPYCFGFGELTERRGDSPFLPAHRDDILAVFAEMRLPLDTSVVYGGRRYAVRDLLRNSVSIFDPHQELEFTAVAYAAYLAETGSWRNRFGEVFDFNHLVLGLLSRANKDTACLGTHVPYGLACVLQADSCFQLLDAETRSEARAFLFELSLAIEMNQADFGAFLPRLSDWDSLNAVEQFHQALLFTGHTLEWMALVDGDLRASDSSLRRAWSWGLSAIEAQDRSRFHTGFMYAVNSHLVRALCMLADTDAVEVLGATRSRED